MADKCGDLLREAQESSPQVNMMNFTKEEREIETITTKIHCRGSKKIHNRRQKKRSQEDDRELLELAKYILCFEKQMQVAEAENQRYGWVTKREVRWNSIQVKLQQNMVVGLKQELRAVESEMEVSYCEHEQGPLIWRG